MTRSRSRKEKHWRCRAQLNTLSGTTPFHSREDVVRILTWDGGIISSNVDRSAVCQMNYSITANTECFVPQHPHHVSTHPSSILGELQLMCTLGS